VSTIKNDLGQVVPIRERRSAQATLAALNNELVIDLNGDAYALVYVQSNLFVGTLEFTGCVDEAGALFFPVPAYGYLPGHVGGTVPPSNQPILTEGLIATALVRVYSIPVGQLRKLRIRASAFTSGACTVHVVTDTNRSMNITQNDQNPATLCVTATAAVGVATTLTIPAVTTLRTFLDSLEIVRSATAALTASATPVVVTTTGIPGTPAFTFGQDVAGIGIDKVASLNCGPGGIACNSGAVTVVCPAYVGVIWRVNAVYHLGG